MTLRLMSCVMFCVVFGCGAVAQEWESGESNRGAWAVIQDGKFRLDVSCWPNESTFFFNLSGGPFEGMKNIDDGNDSMMLWMEQPDGRLARHPIDGHYFGPDRTFVGRFLTSDIVLDQFRNGTQLWLTGAGGVEIVRFPMTGTGKARGHFQESCGL